MSAEMNPDVIATLAGLSPGSHLDVLRARREQARMHSEASYHALFEPRDPGGFTLQERFATASLVAGIQGQADVAAFYVSGLTAAGATAALLASVEAAISDGTAKGPYGHYAPGPLSREDAAGPDFRVAGELRPVLGPHLAAAFEHAHMLVFHPRDAAPAALQVLLDAGWSTTDIVTLSQLVAFLSYQVRVAAGLRVLAATPSFEAPP